MKNLTGEDVVTFYAAILEEIKARFATIDHELASADRRAGDENAFVHAEHAYLQIRYICELIALAAVVAHHGSLPDKTILDQYHPEQIFKKLAEINAASFLKAMKKTGPFKFVDNPGTQLTREQLKSIYGKTNNYLHRGSLKHGAAGLNRLYQPDEIRAWTEGFRSMLEAHSIEFPHLKTVLLAELNGRPGGGARVIMGAEPEPTAQ